MAASPYADDKDPPQLQLRHDMMRAKLDGHMLAHARCVFNRYPASNNSLPARYARAIARNCSGSCVQAMPEIDALIRDKPDNPYFWELKGELLREGRATREAIEPLRKAVGLLEKLKRAQSRRSPTRRPRSCWAGRWSPPTIRASWTRRSRILTHVLGADKPLWQGEDDDWMGWWQLAVAYERKGNKAEALLATRASTSIRATPRTSAKPRSTPSAPSRFSHAGRAAG